MALTFRDTNGAPLSYDEMDSNWRFFTGSFTNTGTITAAAFAGDGSAITGVTGEWDGSHNGNASITGSLDVTSDVSSSANVYGVTASFGTYLGDGSQLSGVTSEWDGSRNGNAEITGSLTVTSNISSSGLLYGLGLYASNFIESDLIRTPDLRTDLISSQGTSTVSINDNLDVVGNITASGDVSSSANVYGITGSFSHLLGSSPLTVESDNFNIDSSGNITASGDIVSSEMFRGKQLFLNSGSSQYLNTPAAGDAALIAMSGSGAFSTTSAIAPNNLVLFSEYKTGDTGIVNGKAASSILFTVNHGASNGNNAVAQIACVAQAVSSNYGDLVFSTRGLLNNVTERMRITQNQTTITGSLDVSGALSKGSGTFKIAHPISTGSLYHSFIEGPKCDLIYRGTTTLTNGVADINIDSVSNMTEGTFVALTQDPQLFLQNTTGWEPLKGSISGNILSIECKLTSSVDNVSWMVVAERVDDFIKNWNLTDENGHLIPEQ